MREQERIVLVGFGNMGQALARGWLAAGRAPATIRVVDTAPPARAAAASLGLAASDALADVEAAFRAAVIVLAVKPNQVDAVLAECRVRGTREAVHLSIAAGKTLHRLAEGLSADAALVRAMPNTPAAIGKGITALVANAAVTPAQRELCGELLAAVGAVVWLDDERHMDAVTAVSGSGPAYVFLLVECLERAALELGLAPGLAKQLALATVAGAAGYAERADVPPAELRKRVTSPNGTTQAALEVLMAERGGLADLLKRATEAAARRSRELSSA
ncbi:MAG TPA: pyrroline-5-carboxylate reductase [Gammaproteobacteria bacterium]|nr:pyrroline-5-carboxylate reductase [Gammaproteobacteria bacterium]